MGLFWKSKSEIIAEEEAAEAERMEKEADEKELAAALWESELTRIRVAATVATVNRRRFFVVWKWSFLNYEKFVEAVVVVANELNADALSFEHRVQGGPYTTGSVGHCAVITLSRSSNEVTA